MTEKRPSWKDILWTPVYDFFDSRWGTRGLRLFAISIGLVVMAVAWWGLNENRAQMQRDANGFVPVQRDENGSMPGGDLFDVVRTDLGPIEPPEAFSEWMSVLDTRLQQYVQELREHIRTAAAGWSENITAMAVFLGDAVEKALRDIRLERGLSGT